MAIFTDARIPVTVVRTEAALPDALHGSPAAILSEAPGPTSPPGCAMLVRFDLALSSHPPSCTCCGGRSAVAVALDRLFLARVKGAAPWFDRVVALAPSDEGRDAVATALRDDAVVSSRFRTAGG